jgi:hypothetical protein
MDSIDLLNYACYMRDHVHASFWLVTWLILTGVIVLQQELTNAISRPLNSWPESLWENVC